MANSIIKTISNTLIPVSSDYGTCEGGYARIGKLVIVNVRLNVGSTNVPNWGVYVKGLPETLMQVTISAVNITYSDVRIPAYMSAGDTTISKMGVPADVKGQGILFTGVYIAK